MSRSAARASLPAVLGALAGLTGTLAHRVVLELGATELPIGLLVAVALTGAVQVAVVAALASRPAALAGVAGWAVAAYAGLATGPGGDYLVARPMDAVGAGWLLGGPLALAAATLAARRAAGAGTRPVGST